MLGYALTDWSDGCFLGRRARFRERFRGVASGRQQNRLELDLDVEPF